MWSFFSRDPTKDFPYEIGEPIPFYSERIYWKLHKGKKKGLDEEVTIFVLDGKNASPAEMDAAKASVKRLKTLRHPNILTFLDSVESDKAILLATEYVEPLEKHLERKDGLNGDLSVSWGLFQITRALSFLINDGNLRHNNVQLGSVFVNLAGEWKLGGLDFVTAAEASAVVEKIPGVLHQLDPPELKSGGKVITKWSVDSWGLGVLIWEVFNGPLSQTISLKSMDRVPKPLASTVNELVNSMAGNRPNPADIIVRGRRPGGFYKNDLVDSLLFLEEIQIKEQNDKTKFFTGLPSVLDKFPDDICRHKILPQLITAFEFGNAGSSVLSPLFKLGKLLDENEYQLKIVPCVVKLFASTDRATRVRLLQQLEHFADHLQPATVNDKIFPNIVLGFMDTNPTVREQTVKAMLHLAPKLNHNNLNVELLKHFARLQVKDDQGGIRTNTTICLGKITSCLHPQTRRKVLIPAFTRVFQDSFPQAKIAGILALAATQQYYLLSEVASRILPALCTLTTDPDKAVRDSAFKTVRGFLGKLEKASEDPTMKEKFESEVDSVTAGGVAETASTWAGWAVSALASKFHRSASTQSVAGQVGQAPSTGRSKGRYPFGAQSSSSTSTTTSSIPSTPSVDRDVLQPTAEGQESATDYDEDWDNEEWGSIDGDDRTKSTSNNLDSLNQSSTGSSPSVISAKNNTGNRPAETDGWDNWAIDENEEKDGWEGDFVADDKNDTKRTSELWESNANRSDVNGQSSQGDFFNNYGSNSKAGASSNAVSDWNTSDDWGGPATVAAATDTDKGDEMRRRREERKLQRQKELEAKKSTKGPMKLGAKKTVNID